MQKEEWAQMIDPYDAIAPRPDDSDHEGVRSLAETLEMLLERKKVLDEEAKQNDEAIKRFKAALTQEMQDDDCQLYGTSDYTFELTQETSYSKLGDDKLAAAGKDFYGVLTAEGLGGIIKQKVDPRTLQKTIREYVEEYGELSDELKGVLNVYEYQTVKAKPVKRGRK